MELEDMDEKQVLAYCRKLKRQASKRLAGMTAEEQHEYLENVVKQLEAEHGIHFLRAENITPRKPLYPA
jgi:hypothetical protein